MRTAPGAALPATTVRVLAMLPAVVTAGVAGWTLGGEQPGVLLWLLAACWHAALAPWRHRPALDFSWGHLGEPPARLTRREEDWRWT